MSSETWRCNCAAKGKMGWKNKGKSFIMLKWNVITAKDNVFYLKTSFPSVSDNLKRKKKEMKKSLMLCFSEEINCLASLKRKLAKSCFYLLREEEGGGGERKRAPKVNLSWTPELGHLNFALLLIFLLSHFGHFQLSPNKKEFVVTSFVLQ